jgi:hypothetical protein
LRSFLDTKGSPESLRFLRLAFVSSIESHPFIYAPASPWFTRLAVSASITPNVTLPTEHGQTRFGKQNAEVALQAFGGTMKGVYFLRGTELPGGGGLRIGERSIGEAGPGRGLRVFTGILKKLGLGITPIGFPAGPREERGGRENKAGAGAGVWINSKTPGFISPGEAGNEVPPKESGIFVSDSGNPGATR